MARKNHLLPCVKAIDWTTTTAGHKKRVYDKPATPYGRLMTSDILDEKTRTRLKAEHASLDPAKITRQINTIQTKLIQSAEYRTQSQRQAA